MFDNVKRWITVSQCRDKHIYRILARNGRYGLYDKSTGSFKLNRYKNGDYFLDIEHHWDVDSGTVKPLEDMGICSLNDNELSVVLSTLSQSITYP